MRSTKLHRVIVATAALFVLGIVFFANFAVRSSPRGAISTRESTSEPVDPSRDSEETEPVSPSSLELDRTSVETLESVDASASVSAGFESSKKLSILVRVVDEETTQPIAGCPIVERRGFVGFDFRRSLGSRGELGRTDRDGVRRIVLRPSEPDAGEFRTIGVGPPYFAEDRVVSLAEGELTEIDFAVRRLATISGRVLDPAGRPIRDAVVAWRIDHGREDRGVSVNRADDGDRVVADEDGRFVLPYRPAEVGESRSLFATANDHTTDTMVAPDLGWGESAIVDFTLQPTGVRLSGRVIPDSGSIGKVRLFSSTSDSSDAARAQAAVDSEGRFVFENVPQGEWKIDAYLYCFGMKSHVDLRHAPAAVELGDVFATRVVDDVELEFVTADQRPISFPCEFWRRGARIDVSDAGRASVWMCPGEDDSIEVVANPTGLEGDRWSATVAISWLDDRRVRVVLEPTGILVVLPRERGGEGARWWVRAESARRVGTASFVADQVATRFGTYRDRSGNVTIRVGRGDEVLATREVSTAEASVGTVRIDFTIEELR